MFESPRAHQYNPNNSHTVTAEAGISAKVVLLHAAREGDAAPGESDEYGERYAIDFKLLLGDRQATIRSSWMIRHGDPAPRLQLK